MDGRPASERVLSRVYLVRHAIGHTVAALPLGLGACVSLALRERLPRQNPRHPLLLFGLPLPMCYFLTWGM
jgi:hypothetical protein